MYKKNVYKMSKRCKMHPCILTNPFRLLRDFCVEKYIQIFNINMQNLIKCVQYMRDFLKLGYGCNPKGCKRFLGGQWKTSEIF